MSTEPGDGVHDAVSLARLTLPAEHAAQLAVSCGRTVARWRALPQHDGEPSAPSHPAGVHDVLRDDEPQPGLTAEDALARAPRAADGAFVVPRVTDVS